MRTKYTKDNQNRNDWVDDFIVPWINQNANGEEQLGILQLIQKGIGGIEDSSGDELEETTQAIKSDQEDYVPTMNVDNPIDWRQDSNKLDDIEDEREAAD